MRKRIFIFSILVSIILCLTVSLAYFINSINDSEKTIEFAPTLKQIEVNEEGFYQFINNYYYSKDGISNEYIESSEIVSKSVKRFTIKLTESIILKNDILITSDCHIDLSSYDIDLNGFSFTIRNLYEGTMIIYSSISEENQEFKKGKIIDSLDKYKIVIDTPRGNVILPESDSYTYENCIVSDKELSYSAMKYVLSNIQNSTINDFYSIVKDDINPIESRHCIFHNLNENDVTDDLYDSIDGCIYTYTDLQLVNNYFNNPNVNISYTVEKNDCITNNGDIISLPSTGTIDVDLTITVTVGENEYKKTIIIHVVSPSDYKKAVVANVIEYLNIYSYYEEGVFKRYNLDGTIELPIIDKYFGSTGNIIYSLYNENKELIINSSNSSSTSMSYFTQLSDNTSLLMSLNSNVKYITIGYLDYTSPLLPIEGVSKSMIIDNRSYALGIIREVYGESLKITPSGTGGYNTELLYLAASDIMNKYDRLVNVSYEIINDTDDVYEHTVAIGNETADKLFVKDAINNPPNITQTPMLSLTFEIKNSDGGGTEKNIVLNIPIEVDSSNVGNGIDAFSQYYNYFDKEFTVNSNNHTYHDFELPISFGSSFPIYQFKIYQVTNEFLETYNIQFEKDAFIDLNQTQSSASATKLDGLYNLFNSQNDLLDDDLFTLYVYYSNTIVEMVDMDSNANNISTIVSSSLGRTFIDINQFLIPQEDSYYIFFYQPCEKQTIDGNIVLKFEETYDYFSLLTIPGIVRFETTTSTTNTIRSVLNENEKTITAGSEVFADKKLYEFIWNYYSDEDWNFDDQPNSKKYGNNFILSSRLNNYIDVLKFGEFQTPKNTTYSELINEYNSLPEGEMLSINSNDIPDEQRFSEITNYKGIELLDGVEVLYLCGVNVGTSNSLSDIISENKMQIEYIAGMSGLKVLDISYNNLTDRPAGLADQLKFPTGADNQFISKLSPLSNLEFLFVNNNYFYSFAGIETLTSLKYANVDNNRFTVTYFGSILNGLLEFIDNLLTNVVNSIYGNAGATNISYFSQLNGNGVMLQGYSGSNVKDTRVQAMMAIEYQNRLQSGIDISCAYKSLSTNINDYDIPAGYIIYDENEQPMAGITVTEVIFNFVDVDPDTFALELIYSIHYHRTGSLIGGEAIDKDFDIKYYVEYQVERY